MLKGLQKQHFHLWYWKLQEFVGRAWCFVVFKVDRQQSQRRWRPILQRSIVDAKHLEIKTQITFIWGGVVFAKRFWRFCASTAKFWSSSPQSGLQQFHWLWCIASRLGWRWRFRCGLWGVCRTFAHIWAHPKRPACARCGFRFNSPWYDTAWEFEELKAELSQTNSCWLGFRWWPWFGSSSWYSFSKESILRTSIRWHCEGDQWKFFVTFGSMPDHLETRVEFCWFQWGWKEGFGGLCKARQCHNLCADIFGIWACRCWQKSVLLGASHVKLLFEFQQTLPLGQRLSVWLVCLQWISIFSWLGWRWGHRHAQNQLSQPGAEFARLETCQLELTSR